MSNICFLDVRICCFVGEFGVVGLICGIWESVIKIFYFTINTRLIVEPECSLKHLCNNVKMKKNVKPTCRQWLKNTKAHD